MEMKGGGFGEKVLIDNFCVIYYFVMWYSRESSDK